MPSLSVDFLCLGLATLDLLAEVEEFPVENSKCEVPHLACSGGGPAANAAILLSRWGARCAFAGVVGNDDYGQSIRREFEAVGTDVSLLELRPGHPTPVSMIWVNRRNGSRTIVNRRAPGRPLELEPERVADLAPRFLLFDGHEYPAALEAMDVCPEATSMLDAGSWREGTEQLAGEVSYLVASERFAGQATNPALFADPDTWAEGLRQLRERFPTRVVVTLGERGLVADDGTGAEPILMPAFPATVRDTTGAGDIFHGAFAFSLHSGADFRESLRFASMAASLSVSALGGRDSIPDLDRVRDALAYAGTR